MNGYSIACLAGAFLLFGIAIGFVSAPKVEARSLGTIACETAGGVVANRARDWLNNDEEAPE